MTGSLKFVLVRADKSRGGQWDPDEYDVQDEAGHVVGRIMRIRTHRPTMVLDHRRRHPAERL